MRILPNLYIDVSDVQAKIDSLRTVLSEKEFKQLARRVVDRSGKKVKRIVSTDVPQKYNIKRSVVAADIKPPRWGSAGIGEISCYVPIEGKKHIIGGKTFPAKGGRQGWKGIKAGKRYKITTQIVKGKTSELPEEMKEQGGHPPFRNYRAKKLNNATFTRSGGAGFPPDNLPIARVVGLAVPQMPMNRSQEDVQKDIREFMMERVEKEFEHIMKRCR